MRRALALAVLLAALSGCGDSEAPSSTAPTETEPVASVPAPDETMPARCPTEGRDFNGVTNFSAEGVDCTEAKRVFFDWLDACGGQGSPCPVDPGYSCKQERFAGARSDVTCAKGAATVKFSFG